MTLTKARIIDSTYNSSDLNRTQAIKTVETLQETIKKTLEYIEGFMITGFNKFYVKNKNQPKERNPASGEDLILEPRRVMTFTFSPVLKKKMSGEHSC